MDSKTKRDNCPRKAKKVFEIALSIDKVKRIRKPSPRSTSQIVSRMNSPEIRRPGQLAQAQTAGISHRPCTDATRYPIPARPCQSQGSVIPRRDPPAACGRPYLECDPAGPPRCGSRSEHQYGVARVRESFGNRRDLATCIRLTSISFDGCGPEVCSRWIASGSTKFAGLDVAIERLRRRHAHGHADRRGIHERSNHQPTFATKDMT